MTLPPPSHLRAALRRGLELSSVFGGVDVPGRLVRRALGPLTRTLTASGFWRGRPATCFTPAPGYPRAATFAVQRGNRCRYLQKVQSAREGEQDDQSGDRPTVTARSHVVLLIFLAPFEFPDWSSPQRLTPSPIRPRQAARLGCNNGDHADRGAAGTAAPWFLASAWTTTLRRARDGWGFGQPAGQAPAVVQAGRLEDRSRCRPERRLHRRSSRCSTLKNGQAFALIIQSAWVSRTWPRPSARSSSSQHLAEGDDRADAQARRGSSSSPGVDAVTTAACATTISFLGLVFPSRWCGGAGGVRHRP